MNGAVEFLAIEGDAGTAEEAVGLCGAALMDAGCVGERFARCCIEREREFPTGICADVPVALPHCMAEDVSRNGVCYLRLARPVRFRRMDDDESEVEVRHVFNLAIGRGDHLGFLSSMIGMLQNAGLMKRLDSMDIEDVPAFLAGAVEQGA